jgi:hypothetical protein
MLRAAQHDRQRGNFSTGSTTKTVLLKSGVVTLEQLLPHRWDE